MRSLEKYPAVRLLSVKLRSLLLPYVLFCLYGAILHTLTLSGDYWMDVFGLLSGVPSGNAPFVVCPCPHGLHVVGWNHSLCVFPMGSDLGVAAYGAGVGFLGRIRASVVFLWWSLVWHSDKPFLLCLWDDGFWANVYACGWGAVRVVCGGVRLADYVVHGCANRSS